MPRVRMGEGSVDLPEGWAMCGERAAVRQPPRLTSTLSTNAHRPSPEWQVMVLAPWAEDEPSLEGSLETFVAALAGRSPGIREIGRQRLVFDDGVAGMEVAVILEPLPGWRTVQRHICRVDGGVMTHLVASIPWLHHRRAQPEVDAVLRSFTPSVSCS